MIDDDMRDQMALFQIPAKKTEEKPEPAQRPQQAAKPKSTRAATATKKKSPPPPPPRPLSGQVPKGDVRLTANIREDLHLKLKIAAAKRRTTIGELIEEYVETYL